MVVVGGNWCCQKQDFLSSGQPTFLYVRTTFSLRSWQRFLHISAFRTGPKGNSESGPIFFFLDRSTRHLDRFIPTHSNLCTDPFAIVTDPFAIWTDAFAIWTNSFFMDRSILNVDRSVRNQDRFARKQDRVALPAGSQMCNVHVRKQCI